MIRSHVVSIRMNSQPDLKCEIRTWLKSSQIGDELPNFEIEIEGNSEKGDGYLGDIVFARVTGKNRENVSKEYNLTLKCAKRSQSLRDKTPVREVFENEIEIYKTILPAFKEFERSKGITQVFDNLPQCFGTFQSENMEVIILENLKKKDYILWDAKTPVTAEHNELVVKAYARWHATGAAIRDQNPKLFEQCVSKLHNGWKLMMERTSIIDVFTKNVGYACEKLQGILEDNKIEELRKLMKLAPSLKTDFVGNKKYFTSITHGDCWSNNFMYQHMDKDPNTSPLNIAILDWQLSYVSSPLTDLSYYLYGTMSKGTLEKLDDMLKLYYETFSDHLKRLGSDPEKVFPLSQFQDEWKIFGVFGIYFILMVLNIVFMEKSNLPNVADAAEKGEDIMGVFDQKNEAGPQEIERTKYIVEHVVSRGLARETF